jgi:hypothetical protein
VNLLNPQKILPILHLFALRILITSLNPLRFSLWLKRKRLIFEWFLGLGLVLGHNKSYKRNIVIGFING